MILIIEVAAVIILFICLLYVIKYIMLISVKHNADKAFGILCTALPKFYEAVIILFSTQDTLSSDDNLLAENTKNLIYKALNFSAAKDSNEKIIAFANSISENAKSFAEAAAQKGYNSVNMEQYSKALENFNNIKNNYNRSAQKLRHYADVFPTSFFARLKKIKTMDYLN